MSMVQTQLPIIVAVSGSPIPTRFDEYETGMIAQLKSLSGLSKSEIIRRCVAITRLEIALRGGDDFSFLCPPTPSRASARRQAEGRAGRRAPLSLNELRKEIARQRRTLAENETRLVQMEERVA